MDARITRQLNALSHPEGWVRQAAVAALAESGEPAVSALLVIARKKGTPFHASAMVALAELGAVEQPDLLARLRHPNPLHRRRVVEVLLDPRSVPLVAERLTDPDAKVRQAAQETLIQVGAPAIPNLVGMLARPETPYRYRTNPAQVIIQILTIPDESEEAAEVAARIPRELLIDRLDAFEGLVRLAATMLVERVEAEWAVPALLLRLDDPSASVRRRAARALGLRGHSQGVPFLVAELDRDVQGVREESAEALAAITRIHPTPGLRAALPALRRLRRRGRVFQEALAAIETATNAFQDLPVSAASPVVSPDDLPIPADAQPVERERGGFRERLQRLFRWPA